MTKLEMLLTVLAVALGTQLTRWLPFLLFPEAGQAYLSARSGCNVNVQVISEMLGGGGKATTAGAQFPGKTTEDVLPLLKEAIDNYFDDEA